MVFDVKQFYGLTETSSDSSHNKSRGPGVFTVASLVVASLAVGYVLGNPNVVQLFGSVALRPMVAGRFTALAPQSSSIVRSSSALPAFMGKPLESARRVPLRPLKSVAPVAPSGFSLAAYIQEKAIAVEVALNQYVPDGKAPHPQVIFDAMRHSLLAGGKRIRPALVIAACEMVGGTQEMAMPTACALEMIHTMSLIHDDLPMMDNDDFRRGKPTCHKVYGEAIALLAGDSLLAESFAVIARETKGVPADRILKSIANLGTLVGSEGLVGGQVMDMQNEGMGHLATLETVEYIHMHKTAALLEAAVYNGACIGGASDEELEKLRRFAQKIGLAFQIIDDVLDATMSGEQLGKTAGKDEAVSKATYVKVVGLEESRAMASRLIAEAKADLQVYGEKAIPLLALADFITARQN